MIVCNACYGQEMARWDSAMKVMLDSGWATMTIGGTISTSRATTDDTARLLNWGHGEYYGREKDTVLTFVIVTDTTHEFIEPYQTDSVSLNDDSTEIIFWVKGEKSTPIDLGVSEKAKTYGTYLYSVRELHNTSEGVIAAGMTQWAWKDYYQHIYYLDKNKQKLSSNIVVWQSIEVNNHK